jgi:hypothetical protein
MTVEQGGPFRWRVRRRLRLAARFWRQKCRRHECALASTRMPHNIKGKLLIAQRRSLGRLRGTRVYMHAGYIRHVRTSHPSVGVPPSRSLLKTSDPRLDVVI